MKIIKYQKKSIILDGERFFLPEECSSFEIIRELLKLSKIGSLKVDEEYMVSFLGKRILFSAKGEKEWKYIQFYIEDKNLDLIK
jgi:hypothetical protein